LLYGLARNICREFLRRRAPRETVSWEKLAESGTEATPLDLQSSVEEEVERTMRLPSELPALLGLRRVSTGWRIMEFYRLEVALNSREGLMLL
jgi:hypothetical protein